MKVIVSAKAWVDPDDSLEYVLDKFGEKTALRVEKDVMDAIRLLAQFPRGGQIEPWLQHLGLEHRQIVVGPLKIIYRIDGDVILIPEIFDARQDPGRMKG